MLATDEGDMEEVRSRAQSIALTNKDASLEELKRLSDEFGDNLFGEWLEAGEEEAQGMLELAEEEGFQHLGRQPTVYELKAAIAFMLADNGADVLIVREAFELCLQAEGILDWLDE